MQSILSRAGLIWLHANGAEHAIINLYIKIDKSQIMSAIVTLQLVRQ